jgi:hypothetical protein
MKIIYMCIIVMVIMMIAPIAVPKPIKNDVVVIETKIIKQIKHINKEVNKASEKTKEMLIVIKKLIKQKKLKKNSFLHREIK